MFSNQDLLTDFSELPSTFAPFRGIEIHPLCPGGLAETPLADEVGSILDSAGKLLNLRRLHRVIITAEWSLQKPSLGGEINPVSDLANGLSFDNFACTQIVLVDKEPHCIMLMNAETCRILSYPEHQGFAAEYRRGVHSLIREAAHAHDLDEQIKAFPRRWWELNGTFRDIVLFRMASRCWAEYIAHRLSTFAGTEHTVRDLELCLRQTLQSVRREVNESIRAFRLHRDGVRVTTEVTADLHKLLGAAARLFGHMDGLEASFKRCTPQILELIKESRFQGFIHRLGGELRALHSRYGSWSGCEIFGGLKSVCDDLLEECGVTIRLGSEGYFIHIPATPETSPSWFELIEDRIGRLYQP